jgi:WD40 repeat protein
VNKHTVSDKNYPKEKSFRYSAFLSYRNSDVVIARWLHRKVEKYKVPRTLVGQAGAYGPIPRQIGPLYRDRDDARTAEDVETVIAHELSKSIHLIVLCSPMAAAPESWVAREITIFRARRPDGAIHAVIVGGEPPNCFPQPLLSVDHGGRPRTPLAADLRPRRNGGQDGRGRALIKVIAGLIGVDFDDLWRRDRRRRQRNALVYCVTLALLVVFLAGAVQHTRDMGVVKLLDERAWHAVEERRWDIAIRYALASNLTAAHSGSQALLAALVMRAPAGRRLTGHGKSVWDARFSPDGKTVISGSEDGTSLVWDSVTGTRLHTLVVGQPTLSVGFSSDGNQVATASADGMITTWNGSSGKRIAQFSCASFVRDPRLPREAGTAVVFFAKESRIFGGCEKSGHLWNLATREILTSTEGLGAVYASGQTLMFATKNALQMLDVVSHEIRTLPVGTEEDDILEISPSTDLHKVAVWRVDQPTIVIDTDSGAEIARLSREKYGSGPIRLSPDGSHLTITNPIEQTIRLWDIASAGTPRIYKTAAKIRNVMFSPDGKYLAAASDDNSVLVWTSNDDEELLRVKHDTALLHFEFSPDSRRLLTTSVDGSVRIWDIHDGLKARYQVGSDPRATATFSEDGRLYAQMEGNKVLLWDAVRGVHLRDFALNGIASKVTFSADNKTIATSAYSEHPPRPTVALWEVATGKELRDLRLQGNGFHLTISPDGSLLAVGEDNIGVSLWEPISGKRLQLLTLDDVFEEIRFSPDGARLFVAGDYKGALIWDVRSPAIRIPIACAKLIVQAAEFSSTSSLLAVASTDGNNSKSALCLVDLKDQKQIGAAKLFAGGIGGLAIAPNHHEVAVATERDEAVHLIDTDSGVERLRLSHRDSSSPEEAFYSRDGRWLLTRDTWTVHLWEVEGGHEVNAFENATKLSNAALVIDASMVVTAVFPWPDRPYLSQWNLSPVNKSVAELVNELCSERFGFTRHFLDGEIPADPLLMQSFLKGNSRRSVCPSANPT